MTTALEQGLDKSIAAGLFDHADHVVFYSLIQGKIAIDKNLGFLAAAAELFGQTKGAHSVNDAEVDGFGHPPHLRSDHGRTDPENFGGGAGVDIFALVKGGQQYRVGGVMGQHPEINLGIIGGQKKMICRGDKGRPQALTFG